MPRLFTAIELDAESRERLGAEQGRLAAQLGRDTLRWVGIDHLHLTLVFIGEIAADRVPPIEQAMSQPIDIAPFRVEFCGVGVFPPRGAPRALWIGVREGESEVVAVQGQVAARLHVLGVTPELRPFHPHLTMGRWRAGGRGARPRTNELNRETVAQLAVHDVTLLLSRISANGPAYTVLARAPLSGRTVGLH